MTSLKSVALAATCALILLTRGAALAKSGGASTKPKPTYYLSLGDSLAAGA